MPSSSAETKSWPSAPWACMSTKPGTMVPLTGSVPPLAGRPVPTAATFPQVISSQPGASSAPVAVTTRSAARTRRELVSGGAWVDAVMSGSQVEDAVGVLRKQPLVPLGATVDVGGQEHRRSDAACHEPLDHGRDDGVKQGGGGHPRCRGEPLRHSVEL